MSFPNNYIPTLVSFLQSRTPAFFLHQLTACKTTRIPVLQRAFPSARVLIPLRDPIDHAMSMHRQHLRYLDIHAADHFTRDYMEDIGHFEFGSIHLPILFEGMATVIKDHDPRDLDYWVRYWTCAFRHLAGLTNVYFVDIGRFTEEPNLSSIFQAVALRDDKATSDAAYQLLRPIKRYDRPERFDASVLEAAERLYTEIVSDPRRVLPSF